MDAKDSGLEVLPGECSEPEVMLQILATVPKANLQLPTCPLH